MIFLSMTNSIDCLWVKKMKEEPFLEQLHDGNPYISIFFFKYLPLCTTVTPDKYNVLPFQKICNVV